MKWHDLGRVLIMMSHSGSKEEFIFFTFETTKPRKKKTQAKPQKNKRKRKDQNQAVTYANSLKSSNRCKFHRNRFLQPVCSPKLQAVPYSSPQGHFHLACCGRSIWCRLLCLRGSGRLTSSHTLFSSNCWSSSWRRTYHISTWSTWRQCLAWRHSF